jgi:hypothetical protein
MARLVAVLDISCMTIIAKSDRGQAETEQIYSVCFFGRGWIVPEVQFVEAASDQDASVLAGSMRPWMTREVWQRHRLVQVLPPTLTNAQQA